MYEFIESLEVLLNNNFTYTIIFILGMFHALEPGHGKTLILAYLSGGSIRMIGSLKIIGGLIIKVGSKMIDTSLANKFNKIKIAMKGA